VIFITLIELVSFNHRIMALESLDLRLIFLKLEQLQINQLVKDFNNSFAFIVIDKVVIALITIIKSAFIFVILDFYLVEFILTSCLLMVLVSLCLIISLNLNHLNLVKLQLILLLLPPDF